MRLFIISLTLLFVTTFSNAQETTTQEQTKTTKKTTTPGCKTQVTGTIKNFLTGEVIKTAEVQVFEGLDLMKTLKVAGDGTFSFSLGCERGRYIVRGIAENYTLNSKTVYTSSKGGNKHMDLLLYPKREFIVRNSNKYIDTEPIMFETDVEDINEATSLELQKVVDIMDKYPEMILSVEVHTDSKSEKDYAVEITTQRAQIIIDYLAEKGVDAERMEAHGIGNAQLLNHCAKGVKCPESDHRANRRIEFLVIE